eukprot:11705097-Karenia_brevis.AAC.1
MAESQTVLETPQEVLKTVECKKCGKEVATLDMVPCGRSQECCKWCNALSSRLRRLECAHKEQLS